MHLIQCVRLQTRWVRAVMGYRKDIHRSQRKREENSVATVFRDYRNLIVEAEMAKDHSVVYLMLTKK